jgi:hypothetical protein
MYLTNTQVSVKNFDNFKVGKNFWLSILSTLVSLQIYCKFTNYPDNNANTFFGVNLYKYLLEYVADC